MLVRIELCAVCGSDLHPYLGRESGFDPGTVPGHEFVGEVIEVGQAVEGLRIGDRVCSPFTTSCGHCRFCVLGLTARCVEGQLFGWRQRGGGLHGAQAELVRVPLADTTLVPLPEGVSPVEGLLVGDVLATGYHCAEQGGVGGGRSVAVVGCGAVGLMSVVSAFELGAERVAAIDPVPGRRQHAERFGADGASPDDLRELLESSRGGFDVVLEAVGSADSLRLAFELVRPGGTLSSVGVHTSTSFPFSPIEAYDRNLALRLGRCPARALMPRLMPLVQSRRFPLDSVVSHRRPLAEGVEAYRAAVERRSGVIKTVLEPGGTERSEKDSTERSERNRNERSEKNRTERSEHDAITRGTGSEQTEGRR